MGSLGMALNLDTLPEALTLEICDYLDLFSVVALSEVNRTLRNLSKSSKAFWLSALGWCELFIPLPTHRPLSSYSAEELYVAAHRAAVTERNVTSSCPRLRSWRHLGWPYEPSPGVEFNTEAAREESAEEAIHMHLAHPNGNWMFIVSAKNVLRILHLRSGKLALAYDREMFDADRVVSSRVAWAVEFKEEDEATLVMNVQLWIEEELLWWPAIRVFHVRFDEDQCLATMQYVGFCLMNTMPSHLDIAGGYVVAVEKTKWPFEAGDVCLIRWRDMERVPLPSLHPSVRIAAFQEYFISVGVCDRTKLHLQVVGYPEDTQASACKDPNAPQDEQTLARTMFIKLPLTNKPKDSKLSLHSYHIPFNHPLFYDVPFSSFICHFYTGERSCPIKLWVRPGRSGQWSVFPVQLDLADLRSSALRFATGRAYEGEALRKEFMVRNEEQQIVIEEKYLTHWAAPVASGRRFIWWRPQNLVPVTDSPVASTDDLVDGTNTTPRDPNDRTKDNFRLFLSVLDDLVGMDQWDVGDEVQTMLDVTKAYAEGSAAARQLSAARRLEIPNELSVSTASVYMFVMEEWSGTILVQMYAGDLWVLRYGKT